MELVRGNREHGNLETLLGHKTQIIIRCKGGQILPVVVTNRHVHVNVSSRRDYKSLVKYITVSVKVQMRSVASDLGLHCLLRHVCPDT